MGADCQVLKCNSCGSYKHLLDACPDSWESMERENIKQKMVCLSENKDIKREK